VISSVSVFMKAASYFFSTGATVDG
jgi:hypothetical protein